MQTVAITRFGDADVLERLELPAPQPGPGEVAIDVEYAGANFAEILFRQGLVDLPLPFVPGIEVAGTVRAVGAGVGDLRPGQPVAALTIVDGGGYGQVAVTRAELAAPLDELPALPTAVAAATPSNTTTAFLVLDTVAPIRGGERVLVHAAAGGVGSQLGQVARLLGAEQVVGVVGSEAKVAAAERFGYDAVLLRDGWSARADELTGGRGFDVIVDQVGGPQRRENHAALAPLGTLVVMGNASGAPDVEVSTNELWLGNRSVAGFNLQALAAEQPSLVGPQLRRAVEAVARGQVTVTVETLPLDRAADAHRRIEGGATTGKLVLAVGGGAEPSRL
jgi:NADPH2:quinone reductase